MINEEDRILRDSIPEGPESAFYLNLFNMNQNISSQAIMDFYSSVPADTVIWNKSHYFSADVRFVGFENFKKAVLMGDPMICGFHVCIRTSFYNVDRDRIRRGPGDAQARKFQQPNPRYREQRPPREHDMHETGYHSEVHSRHHEWQPDYEHAGTHPHSHYQAEWQKEEYHREYPQKESQHRERYYDQEYREYRSKDNTQKSPIDEGASHKGYSQWPKEAMQPYPRKHNPRDNASHRPHWEEQGGYDYNQPYHQGYSSNKYPKHSGSGQYDYHGQSSYQYNRESPSSYNYDYEADDHNYYDYNKHDEQEDYSQHQHYSNHPKHRHSSNYNSHEQYNYSQPQQYKKRTVTHHQPKEEYIKEKEVERQKETSSKEVVKEKKIVPRKEFDSTGGSSTQIREYDIESSRHQGTSKVKSPPVQIIAPESGVQRSGADAYDYHRPRNDAHNEQHSFDSRPRKQVFKKESYTYGQSASPHAHGHPPAERKNLQLLEQLAYVPPKPKPSQQESSQPTTQYSYYGATANDIARKFTEEYKAASSSQGS